MQKAIPFLETVQNLIYILKIKSDAMDLTTYSKHFHDGNLININHKSDNIEISLESSQINKNKPTDIILSKSNTIKGKLHFEKIKQIKIGNKKWLGILQKIYDDGEILDLEIYKNKVLLLIEWNNFPPKPRESDVSKIEIEAEKIWWENIPTLAEN